MTIKVATMLAGAAALSLSWTSVSAADPTLPGDDGSPAHASTSPVTVAKAGTAVTIGQTTGTQVGCGTATTGVQTATSAPPTYVVPTAGVITSFSHNANAGAGQIRALFFVPGAAGHYTVVGKSALQTVTPSVLNTFPTRIPVPAGALLGSQMTSGAMACALSAAAGDTIRYGSFNPDASSDFVPTTSGTYRWNTSAVLEPDADGDGYGDVTQDTCPQSALTQAACPAPETTVTKKPAKRTFKHRIKVKFSSSVAGSTFTCSLDGKTFKPCTSPYKKRLGLGKHKLLIQAISPFGIIDATPATVKFRIVAPD